MTQVGSQICKTHFLFCFLPSSSPFASQLTPSSSVFLILHHCGGEDDGHGDGEHSSHHTVSSYSLKASIFSSVSLSWIEFEIGVIILMIDSTFYFLIIRI
ncbi:hypothetical protein M5689_023789 [Euphorbia peplus]|nr:hypothetical protein M5689_023789 [Euphorbia peplus]